MPRAPVKVLTKCYIKCIIHSIHLVSILLHNKNRFTITLVKRSPGCFIFYGTVLYVSILRCIYFNEKDDLICFSHKNHTYVNYLN